MTDRPRSLLRHARSAAILLLTAALLASCASVAPSPSPSADPSVEPSASSSASDGPTPTAQPTPSGPPHLVLPPAATADPRAISYGISVELEAGGSGRIVVTVQNLSAEMIGELVLRWPTELRDTVLLAPFAPSEQRIREGGPPLYQEWTRWVEGPGEQGEPDGTTSLGWGPLLVDGTLTIPLLATRVAPGPIEFDLQLLAGNAILTADGGPAWTSVTVP